ncbi:MAG: hypothetical protein ACXWAC_09255 [Usitatibacter sp.]
MEDASRIETKVAFLADPHSYEGEVHEVRAIETHMSWVFLTEAHAYKLKKPVSLDHHDLSTVAARRAHCRLEVRLNRRLSDGVYLETVPLTVDGAGRMHLGTDSRAVDWLILMRRLPAGRMLDRLISRGRVPPEELHAFVARLANFYRETGPEALSGADFRARFAAGIAGNTRELCRFPDAVSAALVEEIGENLLAVLEHDAELFDRRVAEGRIVEGHGDLRPEHVCLEPTPQIIDCLEFSRALRIVDCAEELGFLALECERLGAAQLKGELFDTYATISGDRPSGRLIHFYQGYHAFNRAKLAVLHLGDAVPREPDKWRLRTKEYLHLVTRHLERCPLPTR